jgi:two-component system, LytTR family, response regulator
VIHSRTGVESIHLNDIISLESRSNYTAIHIKGGKSLTTSKTLKEFENQLCDNETHFMRVHNSYIVNLNKTLRYLKSSDSIVMVDDQKIPVAKTRKEVFLVG